MTGPCRAAAASAGSTSGSCSPQRQFLFEMIHLSTVGKGKFRAETGKPFLADAFTCRAQAHAGIPGLGTSVNAQLHHCKETSALSQK